MSETLKHRFETERGALLRRFLDVAGDNLKDSELLEMILAAEPGWLDTSALASRLLDRFGSFTKVVHAEEHALRAVSGMDSAVIGKLKILRLALLRSLRTEITDQPLIDKWSALMDYCRLAMGHSKVEEFRVLFLNHRHVLLADEVMQRGTINHLPVYPREIVKRALEHSAAAIILIHNHPSGDPAPSKADILMTDAIVAAAATIKVTVHDHVIITDADHYSFVTAGLIANYPAPSPASTQYDLFLPTPAAPSQAVHCDHG